MEERSIMSDKGTKAGGPDTILLIRHGEKPTAATASGDRQLGVNYAGANDTQSLTTLGWQRAGALCHLFGNKDLPAPDHVFASLQDGGDKGSLRPEETVVPYVSLLNGIADEAGFFSGTAPATPKVPFDTRFKKGKEDKLAQTVAGLSGTVLVVWQHTDIATICTALGQRVKISNASDIPSAWPSARYDMVYRLRRKPDGRYKFKQIPQMLLPGDSADLFPA